jgi:general secretion pathway protein L
MPINMNLLLLNRIQEPVQSLQCEGGLLTLKEHDASIVKEDVILLAGTECQILHTPMPIKQVRQIIKALPFALEDKLANDLDQNHLVYLGREDGEAYAATISHEAIGFISQSSPCKQMFFLPLLLPIINNGISVLIIDGQACVRLGELFAFSVPTELLALTLEKYFAGNEETKELALCFSQTTDDLLIVQLESLGLEINIQNYMDIHNSIAAEVLVSKSNLLTDIYQVKDIKAQGANNKFKALAALAACLFVTIVTSNFINASQKDNLASLINGASKQYYQQLFPGEKVRRGLKRVFADKLEGASPDSQGATGFTQMLAKASSEIRKNKNAQLQSVRFTDKKGELEISLLTSNIAQLDNIKQMLEKSHLKVEIASANNDGKRIKGLLKVTNNG